MPAARASRACVARHARQRRRGRCGSRARLRSRDGRARGGAPQPKGTRSAQAGAAARRPGGRPPPQPRCEGAAARSGAPPRARRPRACAEPGWREGGPGLISRWSLRPARRFEARPARVRRAGPALTRHAAMQAAARAGCAGRLLSSEARHALSPAQAALVETLAGWVAALLPGDPARPCGLGRSGVQGAGRRFCSGARGAGRRSAPPCAPANPAQAVPRFLL
jgi:hypothetical protein